MTVVRRASHTTRPARDQEINMCRERGISFTRSKKVDEMETSRWQPKREICGLCVQPWILAPFSRSVVSSFRTCAILHRFSWLPQCGRILGKLITRIAVELAPSFDLLNE